MKQKRPSSTDMSFLNEGNWKVKRIIWVISKVVRHTPEVNFRCASNQLLVLRKHHFNLVFCTCKLVIWISLILSMFPETLLSFIWACVDVCTWCSGLGSSCFAYTLEHCIPFSLALLLEIYQQTCNFFFCFSLSTIFSSAKWDHLRLEGQWMSFM